MSGYLLVESGLTGARAVFKSRYHSLTLIAQFVFEAFNTDRYKVYLIIEG